MTEDDASYDFKMGYWQGVHDIFILMMEIDNANLSCIQEKVRGLIDKTRKNDGT